MIPSEKVMISVFWNPNGIKLIDALRKGEKFASDYYCSRILKDLCDNLGGLPDKEGKYLHVHADNARPHTTKFVTRYL